MSDRTIFLVDGENLLHRFEDTTRAGRIHDRNVIYSRDRYVWHPRITNHFAHNVLRVSYYTTAVGDEKALDTLASDLRTFKCHYLIDATMNGACLLVPHVFKKEAKNTKTKSVDINITIDALRHAYNKTVDNITLISGDGDYIPLVQELHRSGVSVTLMAFSSGLNPRLKQLPDDFVDLDQFFFAPITASQPPG